MIETMADSVTSSPRDLASWTENEHAPLRLAPPKLGVITNATTLPSNRFTFVVNPQKRGPSGIVVVR